MRNIIRISIISLILILSSCTNRQSTEYLLDLSEVADINYGSTTDGDSLYWIIYEEWHSNCKRHLLYTDKETYDSLKVALEQFQKAKLVERDSLNKAHGFRLIKNSEGLHLCSIR